MNEIQILRRRIELRKQILPKILDETRADIAKKNRLDAQMAVLHMIKEDLESKIDSSFFDSHLSNCIDSIHYLLEQLRDVISPKP